MPPAAPIFQFSVKGTKQFFFCPKVHVVPCFINTVINTDYIYNRKHSTRKPETHRNGGELMAAQARGTLLDF